MSCLNLSLVVQGRALIREWPLTPFWTHTSNVIVKQNNRYFNSRTVTLGALIIVIFNTTLHISFVKLVLSMLMSFMSLLLWGRLLEGLFIGTLLLIIKKNSQRGTLIRKRALVGRRVLNRIVTIFRDCCLLQLSISYDPGGGWVPSPFLVWLLQRNCAGGMFDQSDIFLMFPVYF